jgi:predicted component of type VI protein secretion system
MPIRLVVRVPRGTTTDVSEHTFTRATIIVGRSPDCDLVLPGDEVRVSRQHIRLERREAGYLMVDLGSRNGTLLNGQQIEPSSTHPLNETDVVKMGTVELEVARVVLDDAGGEADAEKADAIRKGKQTSGRSPAIGGTDPVERAALQGLLAVSKHFVGEGEFTTPEQVKQFAEMIRLSLDVLLEGLHKALSQRKQFEGEFDAQVTMAFQRDANPIKQKQELEQFKRFPLDWKLQPPLLEVKDSLERATNDIAQHQMGLLAGMQQVLDAIVKRLDPLAIEKTAKEKASLLKRLAPAKIAWNEYLNTYSAFLAESSKMFNEMIYPNLQKGYLLSHKDKTRIMQSVQDLAKRAEVVAEVAAQNSAELKSESGSE